VIVLDASVLIAQLDENDAQHDAARALLSDTGDAALAASALTVAEVLVAPVRRDRLHVAERALRALGVTAIGVGPDDGVTLARLRAQSGLKLPDCCVLLAAERIGASGVATFDYRLAAVAGSRGLEVLGAG